MPRPCKLTFYLLTLKVVSESRVTCQFVPILVFLGLSVLDLGPMYETDRQTSDTHNRLMPPPYGDGGIIMHHQLAPQPRWQRSGNKPLRHVVTAGSHMFQPIALETLSPINESAVQLLNGLGHRITSVSADDKEGQFLFQRLSIALQRFNAILLHVVSE